MSFEESVDYYIELLRLGFEGAKAADPEVVVAGLDVSGGDFRRGLKFKRAVLERAAGLLDLFTGHPYASPRYFGRGESPNGPRRAGSTRSVKRSSNYWRNSESPEGCG